MRFVNLTIIMAVKNENLAYNNYQKMNQYWINSHLKLLYFGCVIGFIVELIIMFVVNYFNELSSDMVYYILKYILSPLFVNFFICLLGTYVVKNRHYSYRQKQYILSVLTVCLTFVFSVVHNAFVSILLIQGLPILVTVVYEDERLTTIITIMCLLLMYLSGCYIVFDPDKYIDNLYILNMLVLLVVVFILWVISCYMIQFSEKKRKIIIQGDIEKFDLQKRIYIDGLTLIGNKSAFDQRIEEVIVDKDCGYHLAIFDIDFFKQFNDSYGHLFGDRVLTTIGEILLTEITGVESFRYGGDEFCIIFENMTDVEVMDNLKKVQRKLRERKIMDKTVYVTISVGVAKKDKDWSKEEWISYADKALYKSKNNGRNQIVFAKF